MCCGIVVGISFTFEGMKPSKRLQIHDEVIAEHFDIDIDNVNMNAFLLLKYVVVCKLFDVNIITLIRF